MMLCREVRPEELGKYEFPDYVCEIKWDGRRCMAHKRGNKLWLAGRDHPIEAGKYPEIENALLDIQGDFDIDGEIVVMVDGKPDFDSLQSRDKTKDKLRSKMLAKMYPATLIAFDILLADGSDTKQMSLMDRHDLLRAMIIDSPALQVSRLYTQTLNTYNWAKEQGLEGVVVKRSNSFYELGTRSPNWLKCKVKFTEDLEVVEFSENPKGIRAVTADGTAVQISGAQCEPVKEEIMKNHKALIEVQALGFERTCGNKLRQIVFVRQK